MSRRSEEGSAVSLFAFQDVITSITGIMFLIVLMLVLTLLSSYLAESSRNNSPDLSELAAEAARLQEAVKQLRHSSSEQEQKLAELRKLSPEEISKRIKKMQIQLQQMQQMLQQHETQLKQIVFQADTSEREVANITLDIQTMTEQDNKQKEQLKKLEEELKKARHNIQQQKQLMKYSIAESSGKIPILLELGIDGIQLLNTNTQQKLDMRAENIADSLNRLQSALDQFDSAQYYFSIAVKPGGFPHAAKLLSLLKTSGFERGFEIIPDDKTSLFAEKLP